MNKLYQILSVLLIIFTCRVHAEYTKPWHIPEDAWTQIEPHLIAENHPLKIKLDKLFSRPGSIKNRETLKKRGFALNSKREITKPNIVYLKNFSKYVFKLYTDDQPISEEWLLWLRRIEGAALIRSAIKEYSYDSLFSVPSKWIYLLPCKQEDPNGVTTLLIADNMNVLDNDKNRKCWKNKATFDVLDKLYHMITVLGLADSSYFRNIPYTKSGKISFVDTEDYNNSSVGFGRLNDLLSKKNLKYWKMITGQ